MYNVLFVNTKKERCGVHQYGLQFFDLIKNSKIFNPTYAVVEEYSTLNNLYAENKYDFIIYNYHPQTTTKIFNPVMNRKYDCINVCLFHDSNSIPLSRIKGFYDCFIIGDPTIINSKGNGIFGFGRILFNFENKTTEDDKIRVGSFGFSRSTKGFFKIVDLVQNEFDEAEININIPPSNAVVEESENYLRSSNDVQMIRNRIHKMGISLNVTHEFLTTEQVLNYLSKNSINVFPFEYLDEKGGYGISSSTDFALSCKKPFAISKSIILRHILKYNLPITIEDFSLKQIIKNGTKVLQPIYDDWQRDKVLKEIEDILLNVKGN